MSSATTQVSDSRDRTVGDHGLPVATGLPATFVLCTYVANVDGLYALLMEHGVPGLMPPADRPWGERIAFVQDPDDYPVLVIQRLEDATRA
jgi:lactoylglutathione lyase